MYEHIDFTELQKLWASCSPMPNPIVRYEIDEYGVVNFYSDDGVWRGCTTREGLRYLIENAPKES